MRLVNVSTLQLEEFIPDKIPQYAILSHRWEETGEVLFSDFQNGTARRKAAWEKLEKSCEQAIKDELDYIWIDTCCIDKSSSAELSESINSMFSFYRHAKVCYAYLSDVSSDDDIRVPDSKFFKSLWFTRGWTLQELVAPRVVQFFFKDWKELGERYDLSDILSDITRIPEEVLDHSKSFDEFSIAQRMAWASQRNVTRSEDMAYCLMGLFDVNMPMLYGEGGVKAFIRLQEEIIKISDDTSIFAWVDSEAPLNVQSQVPHGLLATSIKYFANSYDIQIELRRNHSYSMTNKGLRIDFNLLDSGIRLVSDDLREIYFAPLGCTLHGEQLGVYLMELSVSSGQYIRVEVTSLHAPSAMTLIRVAGTSTDVQTVHVMQKFSGRLIEIFRKLNTPSPPNRLRGRHSLDRRHPRLKFHYTLVNKGE